MAQTIQFGDPEELATRELSRRFSASVPEAARFLATFEALDRQYGGHGKLPIEDTYPAIRKCRYKGLVLPPLPPL